MMVNKDAAYRQQIKELRRDIQNAQSELSDVKYRLIKQQMLNEDAVRQLEENNQLIIDVSKQLEMQRDVINYFYGEYQSLRRRNGREQLMKEVRLRDSMIKDMIRYEKANRYSDEGYKLLGMYVDRLTESLEDQGVEIIRSKRGGEFDPELQKPIQRVISTRPEDNNKIYRVFNNGYKWEGIMLKKADVAVCIYSSDRGGLL